MFKNFFQLTAITILVLLFATISTAQVWNLQVVDNTSNTGYNSHIVTASNGTPYIMYSISSRVYLAWWDSSGENSGGWNSIEVGRGGGTQYSMTSLCIDSYDNLHMAWDCYLFGKMYYAVFDTNTKTFILSQETVLSTTPYYTYPELTLVENEGEVIPAIAYVADTYGPLNFAIRDSGSGVWSTSVIYDTHSVGTKVSLAVDSNERFHLSFHVDTDLMYATKALLDTTWACTYVDIAGDVGLHSSIIIDENDDPFIVYYDEGNGDLKYAKLISE